VPLKIQVNAGCHINEACQNAAMAADQSGEAVEFDFNEIKVVVRPGEKPDDVAKRWNRDREAASQAYLNSDEYKSREAERKRKRQEEESRVMVETAQSEAEMRECKVPWPRTRKQLDEYVESLVAREHDYGTSAYSASLAATAAFQYICGRLGLSGFQASCADLDFLRRSRSLSGPFMILKLESALYPQSDPIEKAQKFLTENRDWLETEARKKLLERSEYTHPDVLAHWKQLAGVEKSQSEPAANPGEADQKGNPA